MVWFVFQCNQFNTYNNDTKVTMRLMRIMVQFAIAKNVNSSATALTQVHTQWMRRGVQNVKSWYC